MSRVDDKIVEIVQSRISELMKLDPRELRSLPEYIEEQIEVLGKKQYIRIWHSPTQSGEDLVVVQRKNTKFLGIGIMVAVGIVISGKGQIRDAEDELMWEYR